MLNIYYQIDLYISIIKSPYWYHIGLYYDRINKTAPFKKEDDEIEIQ